MVLNAPLVWAEIDLQAIANNVQELRRITKPEARMMAAVKANAYGHGMVEVAKTVLQSGADELGVARIEEAVQLREAGIDAPILIFGKTPSSMNERLIEFDIRPTVFDAEAAESLSKTASSNGAKIKAHLKVDTGMGRLGILPEKERVNDVTCMAKLPGIEIEGIYTHFATADVMDKTYARKQFELFSKFLDQLDQSGIVIPIKHAANSAGVIDLPETHLDMVRPGISVYGLYPSEDVDKTQVSLQPAMELKARIIHLKRVPAGFKVSYGSTYETKADTAIATIPIGYGDGYSRLMSSRGEMLVRGQRAPVAGRVCMDLTMLDVGHIPDVKLEDEVVIFGKQGNNSIHVDEIASILNTINYEVVTTVTNRVPRIFVK
jgi:alanine racemase